MAKNIVMVREKMKKLVTGEELDEVILGLNLRGYSLDFNVYGYNSLSCGMPTQQPSGLDFTIDEEIICEAEVGGEMRSVSVLAVTTSQYHLKGFIINYCAEERYWSLGEIIEKFKSLLHYVFRFIYRKSLK